MLMKFPLYIEKNLSEVIKIDKPNEKGLAPIYLKFEFFEDVWKINKKCEIFTPCAKFLHPVQNFHI